MPGVVLSGQRADQAPQALPTGQHVGVKFVGITGQRCEASWALACCTEGRDARPLDMKEI